MYFWRIEHLEDQMASRPFNEREILPYLIVIAGLSAAVGFIPGETLNVWDYVKTSCSVVLAVLGTIWIYRQNDGANGRHLLQRYLVIGWVVGIRWVVALIALFVLLFTMKSIYGSDAKATTWYEAILLIAAEIALYWRVGVHVGNVARRARSA